jgi:putative ABC transport system permease protein
MHIARMVLKEALLLAVLALAVGLAVLLAMSALLRGFLFGVGATDPGTLAMVSCSVLGVVVLAALLPARRALRVDPTMALRYE